jgi:hypothetical protein
MKSMLILLSAKVELKVSFDQIAIKCLKSRDNRCFSQSLTTIQLGIKIKLIQGPFLMKIELSNNGSLSLKTGIEDI